jgi:organic hydroperoxide reductase OsmC/OhrA
MVRNQRGRLRIGGLKVRLAPDVRAEDRERIGRCLDLFEDFCIVTQSVREGLKVEVEVVPQP